MTEALIAALDWMDAVNWCDEPHAHMDNSRAGRCDICYQARAVQRKEALTVPPTRAGRGESTAAKPQKMW